jgi:hypothetical protein
MIDGRRGAILTAACLAAHLLGTPAAEAATIDFATAGCAGTICGPFDYGNGVLELTATGGNFQYKTLNGATGLGISGRTGGEIDPNEAIIGTFSSLVLLDSFRVLFLYNGPEFGDPNEKARVSINDGALSGTLTVNGENNAVWSRAGATVSNCGATTEAGIGCFLVTNPFGSAAVSNVKFTAVNTPTASNNSDYSLHQLSATSVPEPAAVFLLGLGAFALGRRLRTRERDVK